jgi:hypothetical protein
VVLPWQGTGYRLSQRLRDFPGPFAFSGGGEIGGGYLFRDTMLELIHSDNLECKELTKPNIQAG